MRREGLLRHVERNRYVYVGEPFIFRCMRDLQLFKSVITATRRIVNYPGFFLRIYRNKCSKEILECPERMAIRLKLQ